MGDIVESLFGPTPFQVQQQQNLGLNQAADRYAQQDPFQRAAGGFFRAGGMLAGPAVESMGMVNPAVQQAQVREQVMGQGGDISTSAGLKAKAAQFQAVGDSKTAMQLMMLARRQEAEEQKMLIEQRKAILSERKQEFQEQDAMELKRQQLQRAYELAKERAADARNSAADRAAAMRESNQIKLMLGQAMLAQKQAAKEAKGPDLTVGQKAADRKFGADYAEYQAGGGSADVEKQLNQLRAVAKALRQPGNDYTGPAVGLIPEKARAFTNQAAVDAKNKVEEVAQRNLRLILGAQFTQLEGERLIARAYNPSLKPEVNATRVEALVKQIETAAKAKEDAARHFEANGTLAGWKGRIPTLSDIEEAVDKAVPDKAATTPKRIKFDARGNMVPE